MQSEHEGDLSTYHRKIAAKEQKISLKQLKISSVISDWEGNVDRVTEFHTSLISYKTSMQQQLHDLYQELDDLYQELHDHYRALNDTNQLKRLRRLEEVSRTITTGKIKNKHNSAFIISYYHMLPTSVA